MLLPAVAREAAMSGMSQRVLRMWCHSFPSPFTPPHALPQHLGHTPPATHYLSAFPAELQAFVGRLYLLCLYVPVLLQGKTLSWASLTRLCKTPILSMISLLCLSCYLVLTRLLSFCAYPQTHYHPLGVPSRYAIYHCDTTQMRQPRTED